MSVSSVGNNLTVAIDCRYVSHHEWMSFLLYWSCVKHLPEAKVSLACNRHLMNLNIFNWCSRCDVPLIFHKFEDRTNLHEYLKNHKTTKTEYVVLVDPHIVFLRDFEEASFDSNIFTKIKQISEVDGVVSDIKSENPSVCCNYSNGWGKFVTPNWINKNSIPFSDVNFADANMSINENRLARIWKSATKIYPKVSRG